MEEAKLKRHMMLFILHACMFVRWRQAKDILTEHNANTDLNSSVGLHGAKRRFVKFNGGVSADQLSWLDRVLQRSDENNEVVLVAGWFLVHCGYATGVCTFIIKLCTHCAVKIFRSLLLRCFFWCCWFGVRKSNESVKNEWWGAGVVPFWTHVQIICIWSIWCHCQLIISCFFEIQNDFTFLVSVYRGYPGKKAHCTGVCLVTNTYAVWDCDRHRCRQSE